jgi:hypothetical protein
MADEKRVRIHGRAAPSYMLWLLEAARWCHCRDSQVEKVIVIVPKVRAESFKTGTSFPFLACMLPTPGRIGYFGRTRQNQGKSAEARQCNKKPLII